MRLQAHELLVPRVLRVHNLVLGLGGNYNLVGLVGNYYLHDAHVAAARSSCPSRHTHTKKTKVHTCGRRKQRT